MRRHFAVAGRWRWKVIGRETKRCDGDCRGQRYWSHRLTSWRQWLIDCYSLLLTDNRSYWVTHLFSSVSNIILNCISCDSSHGRIVPCQKRKVLPPWGYREARERQSRQKTGAWHHIGAKTYLDESTGQDFSLGLKVKYRLPGVWFNYLVGNVVRDKGWRSTPVQKSRKITHLSS